MLDEYPNKCRAFHNITLVKVKFGDFKDITEMTCC